ncbi:MAG: aminoacyl-tRNA hydrolase [Chloroflexi bacterium]|nr:aminoacyl-tRNA hydrolase [Chloroflexota bacterium]
MAFLRRLGGRGRERPSSGAYLIVGLGNPERRYAANRHNIGFQCVDVLAERHDIAVTRKRFNALLGEGRIGGERVALLKPQTFMNDSGRAVAPARRWYKASPERILVIYDDLDLPLGKLRIRQGGSSGGHHGINSIIESLGSADFVRLRVGIGRPPRGRGDPVDYVLNDFGPDQVPVIEETRERVAEAVGVILAQGVTQAMNDYNGL